MFDKKNEDIYYSLQLIALGNSKNLEVYQKAVITLSSVNMQARVKSTVLCGSEQFHRRLLLKHEWLVRSMGLNYATTYRNESFIEAVSGKFGVCSVRLEFFAELLFVLDLFKNL